MSAIKAKTQSNKNFSEDLNERILKLEDNLITVQKAINNLQYHFSTQSSQTELIKTINYTRLSEINN